MNLSERKEQHLEAESFNSLDYQKNGWDFTIPSSQCFCEQNGVPKLQSKKKTCEALDFETSPIVSGRERWQCRGAFFPSSHFVFAIEVKT